MGSSAIAQSTKEIALAKARHAIELMDAGKTQESVALLEEAHQLDPSDYNYSYELALAHSMQKDYAKAVSLLEPLLQHPQVSATVYQLLGNCYDYLLDPALAKTTYEKGLAKFPASGVLLVEFGNLELNKKNYQQAINFYEKAIEQDPAYVPSYYRAARLYLISSQNFLGMIYGEMFVNLERRSKRSVEISKLLFDTYKSQITFPDKLSYSLNFSKTVIDASSLKNNQKPKIPFDMIYETDLGLALLGKDTITLHSLKTIRGGFISSYFHLKHNVLYPNVLFDYQQRVAQAGHEEAYNYWLLNQGSPNEFKQWYQLHEANFKAFNEWFKENPLTLDAKHKFYRAQY